MRNNFKIGDHGIWNSGAGRINDTIIRVRTRYFNVRGHTHDVSPATRQYGIKSSRTEPKVFHKPSALTKLRH